jgi:hypothetical protein
MLEVMITDDRPGMIIAVLLYMGWKLNPEHTKELTTGILRKGNHNVSARQNIVRPDPVPDADLPDDG